MMPLTNGDPNSRPERTARLAKSTALKRMRFVVILNENFVIQRSFSRSDAFQRISTFSAFIVERKNRVHEHRQTPEVALER